jgi:hypothetical protein
LRDPLEECLNFMRNSLARSSRENASFPARTRTTTVVGQIISERALTIKIDGACHCGAITYEAELQPDKVGICHCSDCQTLSASAFRTIALVQVETFSITKGEAKEYIKSGDSGNPRVQAFCADCGSGLYATDAGQHTKTYNIRLGTVRQRSDIVPVF